ncbi:galanin receptor 2a-like [Antedon mediterranea]|uniref:galanin receptor 2a-like n=1 Tax=Antedon mediterranea TaxID=105859 RepID=UPI003AF61B13
MEDYEVFNESLYDDVYDSSNCTANVIDYSTYQNIAAMVFGIFGVVGNGTVGLFILFTRSLRRKLCYKLICNLALADFIASAYIIPVPDVKYQQNMLHEFLCRFHGSQFLLWSSFVTSGICLLMITVDRYWAIVHPLRYISISTSRSKTTLCLIIPWVYGAVFQNFCFYTVKVDECGHCVLADTDRVSMGIIGFCTFTFTYLLPLFCIFCLYYSIIKNMKAMQKNMHNFSQKGVAKNLSKTRDKLVKVFLFITIFYGVTWAPDQIMFFAYTLGASVYKGTVYNELIVLSAYLNSIMNPFVYAYSNDRFRSVLCFCRNKKKHGGNKAEKFSSTNITNVESSSKVQLSVVGRPLSKASSQLSVATTVSTLRCSQTSLSIDDCEVPTENHTSRND